MVDAVLQHLRHALTLESRPVAVVLSSSSPKAFCSGGDIKAARTAALDSPYEDVPPPGHFVHDIFQAEYSLVCTLAKYPLPIISLCQGVWMGFGVGLAGFGSHRVVTPSTRFAMPENHIGLWPDVGFALLAARARGASGLCLALSGYICDAPEALLHCGFATHLLATEDSMQVLQGELQAADLSSPGAIDGLLHRHCAPPPLPPGHSESAPAASSGEALRNLLEQPDSSKRGAAMRRTLHLTSVVEPAFGSALKGGAAGSGSLGGDLQAILATLQQVQNLYAGSLPSAAAFAAGLETRMREACPTSLAVTLRHFRAVHEALHRGGGRPVSALVDDVMQEEYALAVRLVGRHNFIEGVRAVVVDKDRQPAWRPATLAEVKDSDIDALFAPLPAGTGLRL